jgi:hypothetical protein
MLRGDKESKLSCLVNQLKYWLVNLWAYILPLILVRVELHHSIEIFVVYVVWHTVLALSSLGLPGGSSAASSSPSPVAARLKLQVTANDEAAAVRCIVRCLPSQNRLMSHRSLPPLVPVAPATGEGRRPQPHTFPVSALSPLLRNHGLLEKSCELIYSCTYIFSV